MFQILFKGLIRGFTKFNVALLQVFLIIRHFYQQLSKCLSATNFLVGILHTLFCEWILLVDVDFQQTLSNVVEQLCGVYSPFLACDDIVADAAVEVKRC
jgi:hypothetical protein